MDRRAHELPDDLVKPHNFLIVAFRRDQQPPVDGWLPWLSELERGPSDVAVYELAVTDVEAVVANLGLAGSNTIAVAVAGALMDPVLSVPPRAR